MGVIFGLIGQFYYLYDLCTCSFEDQNKFLIEFCFTKILLLMSIQCIFGLNKFLVPLPGILVSHW